MTKNSYMAMGSTVRGEAHKRKGLPNQDSILWRPHSGKGLPLVLAVADGHGDIHCTQSHVGSWLAVETACTVVPTFFEKTNMLQEDYNFPLSESQKLANLLVRTWKSKVKEHWQQHRQNPPENTSRRGAPSTHYENSYAESHLYSMYGSTLLSVLITATHVFYIQIGDGDILAIFDDNHIESPFLADSRLVANVTTSLCSSEAWSDFRIVCKPLGSLAPSLILLATDGYSNSFKDDTGFLKVVTDLLDSCKNSEGGFFEVRRSLPTWLNETSRMGSGDDITVGLLYNSAVK